MWVILFSFTNLPLNLFFDLHNFPILSFFTDKLLMSSLCKPLKPFLLQGHLNWIYMHRQTKEARRDYYILFHRLFSICLYNFFRQRKQISHHSQRKKQKKCSRRSSPPPPPGSTALGRAPRRRAFPSPARRTAAFVTSQIFKILSKK